MPPDDFEPELDRVLHVDADRGPEIPTVPVEVRGYVTTQELPAVRSVMRSFSVDNQDVNAQLLAGPDARRKSVTLWTETQGLYLAGERQGVVGVNPYGAHLPAGGTLTLYHQNPVWTRGDNATSSLVSVVIEQWAD